MPPRPPDPPPAPPPQPHHSPELDGSRPDPGSAAAAVAHTLDDSSQLPDVDAVQAQHHHQQQDMGQNVSRQQHLVQLQEQLEQSVMRSTTDLGSIRSFGLPASPDDDEHDDALFMAARAGGGGRQRSRTAESDPQRREEDEVGATWSPGKGAKRRSKPRPASSYIPSTAWAGQLSSLAFPARSTKHATGARPSSSPSPSPTGPPSQSVATPASPPRRSTPASAPSSPLVPSSSKLGGGATVENATLRPRSRSSSADPPTSRPSTSLRRSPRPSPTPAFRHSLRLPFTLPSIPASPLPLTSPGLVRSASSPPLLPAIETAGPLSPTFALTPPTAALHPSASGTSGWPAERGEEVAVLPKRHSSFAASRGTATSASAPNLSLLASSPIDAPSAAAAIAPTSSSPASDSPYFPPASTSPSPSVSPAPLPNPNPDAAPETSDSPEGLAYSPGLLIPDTPVFNSDSDREADEENEGEVREKKVADEKRYHALVELVETERGYLEGLRVLVRVYFQTLPFLTLLSIADVHAVVRNAEQLLALHERIGERIELVEGEIGWRREKRAGEEKEEGKQEKSGREKKREERERPARVRRAAKRIAEVFSDELPSFELYNDFCARHAEALDITRSIASRPEWEAYERQCASRAAGLNNGAPTGDPTRPPKNARQNSYPFTAPAVSNSPLPFAATPSTYGSSPYSAASSHSFSTGGGATHANFLPAASSSSISSSSSRSKLRFVDYAISPVQRITRYPLVFGQLDKYFSPPTTSTSTSSTTCPRPPPPANSPSASIRTTWDSFKRVAASVDAAKRQREGEMRTRVVARRMEFNTPLVGGAFCDVLGPTLLVGAMHVLHYTGGDGSPAQATGAGGASGGGSSGAAGGSGTQGGGGGGVGGSGGGDVLKVKYYGCFLYRSHVVMAKIRKRASYEPREWLPLRLFEVNAVEEGQGFLTNSIRLSFRDHHFELGALCKGEKAVWLAQLLAAQAEARETWDSQDLDERGQPTLFDDTVVSSVSAVPTQQPTPPLLQRKSHSRTASSASVASIFSAALSTSPHLGATDEPLPPLPADLASSSPAAFTSAALAPVASTSTNTSHSSSHHGSTTTPQLATRSRFSTTASSILLGRTPSSQRAAVDLRLGDVFSETLLSARAQAARDADDAAASAKRMRTVSGPKRSMTALTNAALPYAPYVVGASTAARMLNAASVGGGPVVGGPASSRLERRRMSSVEVDLGAAGRAEFRGAIGFDAGAAVVYRDDSALPSSSSALSTSPMLASRALPSIGGGTGSTPERGSWARALKKGKGSVGHGSGSGGAGKHRPSLPEIDTALAESVARSSAGVKRGMSTPLSAGGSWSRRSRGGAAGRNEANGGPTLGGQLRRVASHNSLDAGVRMPHSAAASAVPTMLVLPNTPSPSTPTASATASSGPPSARAPPATDVERNNSVSSSASSNETGTRSSSSHVSRMIETPPSSIPPSPDFANIELVDPLACAGAPASHAAVAGNKPPTFSTSPATPQRTTFAGPPLQTTSSHSSPRSVLDGMSSVFRLRRRKSTLGLVPPAVASLSPIDSSPSASQEHLAVAPVPSRSPTLVSTPSREEINADAASAAAAKKALKLQRRASTTLTGLFSAKKRAQSNTSLGGSSGYFGSAAGAASSPHLPLGTSSFSSYSTSPPSSAAPSAYTSPATSPPVSQPPTPGGGVVMDLPPVAPGILPPQPQPQTQPVAFADAKGRRLSAGSGGAGGSTVKARRGFWGMGMTPMS
ncbi:hypothetical protein JCM6882_002348 [Rhodosporidiobolus microsporus]